MIPASDIHDSPYSWLRLAITLAVATIGNVGMWAVVVVLPAIQEEFGGSRADASLPYMTAMFGFAIGSYVVGRLVDRYGITLALIASAMVISVGFALSAVAPSLFVISVIHFAIGFGGATCFGPLIADISHWFMRRRGIAVAVAASGNYISGAFWPLVLSGLIADGAWRTAYLVLAVAALAIMVPLALLLRRQVPQEAHAAATAQSTARMATTGLPPNVLMWLLALAGIGCCMAMAMPQVHIVALCVDFGFGPAVGAEMLSLMLVGGVASRLIFGLLADQLGGVRTLLIGSVLQCIALFLYLPAGGIVSLYIVSLVFGLSQGGIVPSYAVIVREYMPPKEAGARVGLVMMATILGMAFGGWASGWIYDLTGSYRWAFLNGIAWNFLNIAIVGMLFVRARPGRLAAA
ncbi:MAG: MFS transporter [Pseudomonadota bacterium]